MSKDKPTQKRPRQAPRAPKPGNNRPCPIPDQVRLELVRRLAMFDTVREIHADLIEQGIDVSHQAISRHNPDNASSNLSQSLTAVFHATREAWLKELAQEPIASRAFRLRRLGVIHAKAMARGNFAIAAAMLEQAAKEVGNVYTNLAKVQGAALPGQLGEDGPAQTSDERRNMLADRLGEAMKRLPASGPTLQ